MYLLIICYVFGDFLFVCFVAGVSPLLIPPISTPYRGVTCRSSGRISQRQRDQSKTFFSGVKRHLKGTSQSLH